MIGQTSTDPGIHMAIESITTHQCNALRSIIRMTMQRNAILTMLHRIRLLLATLLLLQRTATPQLILTCRTTMVTTRGTTARRHRVLVRREEAEGDEAGPAVRVEAEPGDPGMRIEVENRAMKISLKEEEEEEEEFEPNK